PFVEPADLVPQCGGDGDKGADAVVVAVLDASRPVGRFGSVEDEAGGLFVEAAPPPVADDETAGACGPVDRRGHLCGGDDDVGVEDDPDGRVGGGGVGAVHGAGPVE